MRSRHAAIRVFCVSLAALAVAGCDRDDAGRAKPESTASATATSTSSSAPAAAPRAKATTTASSHTTKPPSLCQRLVGDRSFAASRATDGDVLVLKFDGAFRGHAAVAEQATDLGAVSAEPTVVAPAVVLGDGRIAERVAYGMTERAMKGVRRFVVQGRLPAPGDRPEVAISVTDAKALGLRLGGKLKWLFPPELDHGRAELPELKGRPRHEAEVVGLFEVGELLGGNGMSMWMPIDALRARHPAYDDKRITSLAIRLKPSADHEAWAKRLSAALPGDGATFKVMTQRELQGPPRASHADMLALCKTAKVAPRRAKPEPEEMPTCSGRDALRAKQPFIREVHGDVELLGSPKTIGEVETTPWLPDANVDRREARVVLQAWAYTSASIDAMELHGAVTFDALAPRVVRGKLADVTAKGGALIGAPYAARLGVDVGDALQLGVRPIAAPGATGTQPLARATVRIAAVFDHPGPLLNAVLGVLFVHRDHAASLPGGIGKGRANALSLWAKSRASGALFLETANGVGHGLHPRTTADGRDHAARRAVDLLDALCDP